MNSANCTRHSTRPRQPWSNAMNPRPLSVRGLSTPALLLAAALVIAGCAAPPPAPPAEEPPPPPRETDVLGQDRDFAIVVVQRGENLASLAQRYLGDASKAWWIGEFNGVEQVQPGQEVVIPLRNRNIYGVYASGFQTIPILCYHRFGPSRNAMTVTQQGFEQQMDYLAKNGYRVIPLA